MLLPVRTRSPSSAGADPHADKADPQTATRWVIATLSVIVLAGLAIRGRQLTLRSLWFDEAFSWRLLQFPLMDVLERVKLDNHPPLYFLLLKLWSTLFGPSPLALRSLSVLLGTLTVLGTYFFAEEAFRTFPLHAEGGDAAARGHEIGLIAAALVAFSVLQIRYSQEVRMYALAATLAVFSSLVLLRALHQPDRLRPWLLYSGLALLLAYTHYYGLFTLAAQGAYVAGYFLVRANWQLLTACRTRLFWHAFLAGTVIVAGWLPWLPVFIRQRSQVQSAFWTAPVTRWDLPRLTYQTVIYPERETIPASDSLQLLLADLCFLSLWLLRRKAGTGEWYVLTSVLVPIVLAAIISVYGTRIIGPPRFFLVVHLFFLIGLAVLLQRPPGLERSILVTAVLAGSLWLCARFWQTADFAHHPGARGASEYITRYRTSGEPVIVSSPLYYLPMLYYAEQRSGYYLYSDGHRVKHYNGSAVLTPDDFFNEEQLRAISRGRVWVVEMAGGPWGQAFVPVPHEWKETRRSAFSEAFGLGSIIVVEFEARECDPPPIPEGGT